MRKATPIILALALALLAGRGPDMLIAARSSFVSGRNAARFYVRDGLVAMFDAIDNRAVGRHVPGATRWVDCVDRSRSGAVGASQVFSDYMYDDASVWRSLPSIPGLHGHDFTIEAVVTGVTKTADWFHILAPTNDNCSLGWPSKSSNMVSWKYGNARPQTAFSGGRIAMIRSGSNAILKANGSARAAATVSSWLAWNDLGLVWGKPWSALRGTKRMHCVRFYNRALTDAELDFNLAADRRRFPLA